LSPSVQVRKKSSVISKIPTSLFHCWSIWRTGLWPYRLGYCGSGIGAVSNSSVCGNVP